MTTYARIQDGIVFELITLPVDHSGQPIPIGDLYNSALIDGTVSFMEDISTVTPAPQRGWKAVESDGVWSFSAPE